MSITDDQLRAIEARCESAQWTLTTSSERSICHAMADIHALVAEVRRLLGQVEALAGLVKEAYEMDSWCHDNDQIHKPLPFEDSDAAMNLNAILNGAGSEGA